MARSLLAETRAALQARDGAAALHAGLAAWRVSRAPAVADLIDAISAQISGPPILDEREWTRVAVRKDPLDLGRLLPAIPHLPGRLLPAAGGTLAAFPDDPRLAIAIGAWTRDPPVTSKTLYAFWTAVLGAAVRIADNRVIALFEHRLAMPRGASVFWPRFYTALERGLVKLRALPPPVDVDTASCTRLVRRLEVVEPVRIELPVAPAEPLVRATADLAAGRIAAAIDHVLVAWREVQSPLLADAIDRATRLLPTYDRPLATSAGAVHAAWMDALRTDASGALPQLLQHLNIGGSAQAERRLLELAGLPDDPRTAMRLVELASLPDIPATRNQYWRSLYELVGRIRDVRTCEPLRRQLRDFAWVGGYAPHRHAKRYVVDLVLAPPVPPRLDATRTAQLATLVDAIADAERARDATERALLAAIAEDRHDPGPCLVYADWLLERDHPRGALVALACNPRRSNAEIARYQRLAEVPYVMGYLNDLERSPQLWFGLPRRMTASSHAGALTWLTVIELPLMALVETVTLRRAASELVAPLLAGRYEIRETEAGDGTPLSVLTRLR